VAKGGHAIPADVIVRRYHAGLRNMRHLYLPAMDAASIYDNSGGSPVLIAGYEAKSHFIIHERLWAAIEQVTR
jgi:predicted ABC-type ATPase